MATFGLSFADAIDKFGEKLEGKLDLLLRDVSMEIAENVIVGGRYAPGTPIDTGFARGSWWISVGDVSQPPLGGQDKGVKGLPVYRNRTVPEDAVKLLDAKIGMKVYILTNCVYMRSLEYGHSPTKAPQGMIRLSLNAAPMIIKRIAAEIASQ